MKIASAETIRKLETQAHAVIKNGAPSLMEQASLLCAKNIHAFKHSRSALAGYEIIILAGRGNNGGDGILTGGYLSELFDEKVTVYSLQSPSEMSDEIRRHFCSLPSDVSVRFIKNTSDFPSFKRRCIIVDALLGIGFRGELRGIVRDLINLVNSSGNPVIAIDIPSGIETDTGIGKDAVFADMTVTIGAEKAGLYINDGRIRSGCINFADIGFDLDKIPENEVPFEVTPTDILHRIYRRHKSEPYKNVNGKVLIAGGSALYPGAAVLSLLGASCTGCGMVTGALKARPFSPIPPDIIVRDFSDSNGKCFNGNDCAGLIALAESQDAVVFGMGATANSDTAAVLQQILTLQQRTVLDADALNTLAMFPELLKYKKHTNFVITPHAGEARKLAKAFDITDFNTMPRYEQAAALSRKLNCTVVLKGDKTMTASPDGRVWVNQKGSSALSKGGSGDVLSGIIGGLLAKAGELPLHEIAAAGVLLHSCGADFAAHSNSAFDISSLPAAVRNYLNMLTIF